MKNIFKGQSSTAHGSSLIQITGTNQMLAEGCGEVMLYDENKIIFRAKRSITVEGESLTMTNLESGAVAVSGKIKVIFFED